jgi:hypothetical protein
MSPRPPPRPPIAGVRVNCYPTAEDIPIGWGDVFIECSDCGPQGVFTYTEAAVYCPTHLARAHGVTQVARHVVDRPDPDDT